MELLLAVDIGNTNITLAVFKKENVIANFRITTKIPRTSDEYGLLITDLLRTRGIEVTEMKAAIIASVVPNIMHSFTSAIIRYLKIKPMVVGAGTKTGIRICANALWQETAKLPEIEIKKPKSILAKDTISSIQAGLVYGYIGQTEYIVKKMIEEAKLENYKVVATGGLGKLISESTDVIQIYDPNLTMKGLYHIYRRNQTTK